MFILEEATISDIQTAVATKEISYRELALMYLERIAAVDSCEGGLNSVLEINPDALVIASFMDDERAKGISKGPLHGIPVMLKDNISTGDKMHTSAGSLALADNFSAMGMDADIVRGLREMGAVPLGKVNMTEFANWMAQDMPNGYSSRGGPVKNPYNHEADPSGSSTGSAVAVTANLCTASVGTETYGSIIGPASTNGVVGIKPTAGFLSSNGIIPISGTLDTPGPMARTVRDTAVMLGGLRGMYGSAYSGMWNFGYISASMGGYPDNFQKDYTLGLEGANPRGLRIGVYGTKDEKDSEHIAALEQAIVALENAGATIVKDIPSIIPEKEWDYIGMPIVKHEFKYCMNYYLRLAGIRNGSKPIMTLKDIIEFNEAHKDECLKYGQSRLIECQEESSGRLIEAEYIKALRCRESAISDFNKVFTSQNLDVLIGASEFEGTAPLTGFPSGTIPFGIRENGVPMGMYFIARRFDESNLIRAMYAAEQLIGKRQALK